MPKHLTSPSPSKKLRYAAGPARVAANKVKRMKRHVKNHPNDLQTAAKV